MHGVGPAMASKIVDAFGTDTLDVLDNNPEKLLDVPGLGPAKVKAALEHWEEQRATRRVMTFLMEHDVQTSHAARIYKAYGEGAIARLSENPYCIVELERVGFKTADDLALNMGLAFNDRRRVDAGLVHVLREAEGQGVPLGKDSAGREKRLPGGNSFLPLGDLITAVKFALGLPSDSDEGRRAAELVADRVRAQAMAGAVILEPGPQDEPHVYTPKMHMAETSLASKIRSLVSSPSGFTLAESEIERLAGESEFDPTVEQLNAIKIALTSRISVLTGGPGSGKTASSKMLCDVLDAAGLRVQLCAPTGKAAKRITEATGHEGKTIHRLLEWQPFGGFARNSRNPLETDVLVVDETSMLDLALANQLFDAIDPTRTHVVLVGDVDQLPSVGAGKVLSDVIISKTVPVTRLTKIFRQAARSMIIQAAYAINRGQLPNLDPEAAARNVGIVDAGEILRDYFYIPREDNEDIMDLTLSFAATRIPRQYDMNPITDIQVIAPQRTTSIGVNALNMRLQGLLNASGRPIGVKNFRVGDKLLCKRNDYLNDIMNGEFARITDFQEGESLVSLDVDGRGVVMGSADVAENFVLAYAVTCHSMQGSSAKAVVIPLSFSFFTMLSRPLLYTAITRAEQVCVVVGQKRALATAVSNAKEGERFSKLAPRLIDPTLSGQLV
jgi:exodeoxyribonuclease V alpha subunit